MRPMALRSRLVLPCTQSNGTFARYVPFGDGREVVTRRGAELGRHPYGLEQSRRTVSLRGVDALLVRYVATLSPPPRTPTSPPIVDEGQYHPVSDVLYLPDVEILLRRRPDGFDDAEVAQIFEAIELEA